MTDPATKIFAATVAYMRTPCTVVVGMVRDEHSKQARARTLFRSWRSPRRGKNKKKKKTRVADALVAAAAAFDSPLPSVR